MVTWWTAIATRKCPFAIFDPYKKYCVFVNGQFSIQPYTPATLPSWARQHPTETTGRLSFCFLLRCCLKGLAYLGLAIDEADPMLIDGNQEEFWVIGIRCLLLGREGEKQSQALKRHCREDGHYHGYCRKLPTLKGRFTQPCPLWVHVGTLMVELFIQSHVPISALSCQGKTARLLISLTELQKFYAFVLCSEVVRVC